MPIKEKLARKIVIPSQGQFPLRCGCGGMQFQVHVRPVIVDGYTSATVRGVVCIQCLRVWEFDDEGLMLKGGKVEPREKGGSLHVD